MNIEEVVKKIKSIKSWKWYFEENEFNDFYVEFQEKYPDVDLDKNQIKKLGKALAEGKEVPASIKEEIQGNNVAFKCTYNDSDFNGRCSPELCGYNSKQGGVWCKKLDCININDKYPCYESRIWKDFRFGGGVYHNGPKEGEPIPLRNVKVGKVAILTTLKPNALQDERYIFGVLDINDFDDGRRANEQVEQALVSGNKESSIKINPKIKLNFWDFHINENAIEEKDKKFWGSGLVRYLTDKEVFNILIALKEEYMKNNMDQKEIDKIGNLIARFD